MNLLLMTPTFDSISRFTNALVGRQFGLVAEGLAICILILGLSPFVSWASAPVNTKFTSVELLAESLQHVGPAETHSIVEHREAYGPFEHIDELAAAQGVGSATVDKNRSIIWRQ